MRARPLVQALALLALLLYLCAVVRFCAHPRSLPLAPPKIESLPPKTESLAPAAEALAPAAEALAPEAESLARAAEALESLPPENLDETSRRLERGGAREDLYGREGAVVLGLERCAAYRAAVPARLRRLGVAGLFNAGTNAVQLSLEQSCNVSAGGRNSLFAVPWGKHNPASWRGSHWAPAFTNASVLKWRPRVATVLPFVVVKDPLTWMHSVCRHPYAVRLTSRAGPLCPSPLARPLPALKVAFQPDRLLTYASLPDMWREWHEEYVRAPYPRLMLRYEDFLFDPSRVMRAVCDCAGGRLADSLRTLERVKGPGLGHATDTSTLQQSLQLYADPAKRVEHYTPQDLAFVRAALKAPGSLYEWLKYDLPASSAS